MKLITILFLAGTMAVSATSYSQVTKIDLSFRDSTSLADILRSIEKTSEFIFIYDANIVNINAKMTISANAEKIETVLDKLFQGTNMAWLIDDRQVFLYKKDDLKTLDLLIPKTATGIQQPQTREISGTVTDSNGQPVIGASVVVKGTTIGKNTDINGKFQISVPVDARTLVVSFIGMKQQEVDIAGRASISVQMVEETIGLEEVVVVGYGVQKKENVVGAISQVSSAVIVNSGQQNITNAIAGKLSGVLTMQTTGQPGADDAEIVIRGLSSWNGSQPLVLVDGVERDFTDLDPNEVENISVLKDASSTAVFGARGANGVIIVTTKRGTLGKPKLSISVSYGLEKAARIAKPIDAYTTMSMLNVALMNQQRFTELTPQNILNEYRNPSTPLKALQYPNVNWYNELTKTFAPTATANINIQGGNNFVKYFGSIGYFYQSDLFKHYNQGYDDTRYKYNRFSYRGNLDFTISKSTQLSVSIGGEVGITNNPSTGNTWRSLYYASPSVNPAYFPEWVLQQVPDPDYPDATGIRLAAGLKGGGTGNPYANMYNGSFIQDIGSQLFTDVVLDQKLDGIVKGLSVKGKVSMSTYYSNRSLTASYGFPTYQLDYKNIGVPGVNPWFRTGQGTEVYQMPELDINTGGLNSGYYQNFYYEMGLNYNNTFGKNHISGLALLNRQQKNAGTDFAYYNEALVGRLTYDYLFKYFLEVNVGYTGSERFSPKNRFGFFPSAAFGWLASEEKFFKNAVPWMNKLKFRYSDGIVGSDNASSRWLYINDYTNSGNYIVQGPGANVYAQWEEARKRDLGIEIAVFKNLFNLSVDFFDEYRYKMLLAPQSVTILVANSFKDLNLGKMKKQGIEIEAEFNKITPTGLNYFIKGNFGFNENRIIFKDDPIYAPEYKKVAGTPLGGGSNGVLLTGSGYYTSVDDIHNNPAPISVEKIVLGDYKFLDYTADGTVTVLDKYPVKGSKYPPITYSFSSGFSFKGFNFNFMFQGVSGKYVSYNGAFESEFLKGNYNVHNSPLDYWTPSNLDANHETLHISSGSIDILNWGNYTGDPGYSSMIPGRFWRNANYLRLKEIYAGYNFQPKLLKMLPMVSNLLLYATVNNLITFTKLIEGDPESQDFTYGVYPQMTSFKLGIKITF